MSEPNFTDGRLIIEGHGGRKFELLESVWKHITKDRNRTYYEDNFNKIVETLKSPDRVLQSEKDIDVNYYEKQFDDLYLFGNTVLGRMYNYVLVNLYENQIKTVYFSRTLKNKKVLWMRKP